MPKFTPLAMDKAGVTFTASSTSAPAPEFLALEFRRRLPRQRCTLPQNGFCATKKAQLQISPDGEHYTTLLQFELQAGTPKTVTLDAVQAR